MSLHLGHGVGVKSTTLGTRTLLSNERGSIRERFQVEAVPSRGPPFCKLGVQNGGYFVTWQLPANQTDSIPLRLRRAVARDSSCLAE